MTEAVRGRPAEDPRLRTSRALFVALLLAGCPSPQRPQQPSAQLDRALGDGELHAVAGDGTRSYAALTRGDRAVIDAGTWKVELAGAAGPLLRGGALVVAAVGGRGTVADVALRGSPGVVLVGLDAATGAARWKQAIDASEWALATALAAAPNGDALVGGSFSGTLRAADKVVSSGGKSDGFVARLTARGEVAWLVRVGGPGADAVQGVATAGERIAIAGTFAAGADLLGAMLAPVDDKSPLADAFAAELAPDGTRRWVATFGGGADDAVAGVAIDGKGRVVVAATGRGSVAAGGAVLVAQGAADGVLAWFEPNGAPGPALLLGGSELDGLSAIAAVHGRIVVAGFYTGTLALGAHTLRSANPAGFIAALDGTTIVAHWPIIGEVAALTAVARGFVAGVATSSGVALLGRDVP